MLCFPAPMPLIPGTRLVMGVASVLLCGVGAEGGVDHTRRKVEPSIVRFPVDPRCGLKE